MKPSVHHAHAAGGRVLQRGLIGGQRLSPPGEARGTAARGRDARPGGWPARADGGGQAHLELTFLMYDGGPGGGPAGG